ncbi:MAG: HAMP domain-containing sensor histidine kinase [Chryseolinea sp.]
MSEVPDKHFGKNKQDPSLIKTESPVSVEEKTCQLLQERENELIDLAEELSSQKEELTAAIEELMYKNTSLEAALGKLQERTLELDQILYRTSHDLRSPLSSIKGILSLLKLEPQSALISRYGQHIERSTNQMDTLLQSLASLSKAILEDPIITLTNITEIISEVTDECKYLPSWPKTKVHLSLQKTEMNTDAMLMKIIFQSLFTNAFIFRNPAFEGNIYVQSHEQNGQIEIIVSDDGEGIDPVVLPRIFEMFFRGSERSLGNGLGLYMAQKAVEQLCGHLSVDVTSEKTNFSISLPSTNF